MEESTPSGPAATNVADSTPTRKRLQFWRRLYDSNASAPDWLSIHRWDYGLDVAAAVAADVREKLMLSSQDRLLEVGCGTGAFLAMVVREGQAGWGFDHSEAMVRRGGDFGVDLRRVRLGVSEAACLPVKSGFFDKVVCYSVFQCFPDASYARRCIRELVRVCKPGGMILIGDVFGVMEKRRRRLLEIGLPARLVDLLLGLLQPFWHLWQRFGRSQDRMIRRTYRRGFFQRALAAEPCEVEFLPQQIPGRYVSQSRYDVRIRRHAADRAS